MTTDPLKQYVGNPEHLAQTKGKEAFAAIIGDRPSQYAKSPSIWNPTLQALGIDAVYIPLDVSAEHLGDLLAALRQARGYVGGNVTVPYKIAVIPFLDELDETASRIGAVNTIVRTGEGRLVGYNTDGLGAVAALTRAQPGEASPFLGNLPGLRVLLIGAGGAGRALAFSFCARGDGVELLIANRDEKRAQALAQAVNKAGGQARALNENGALEVAPEMDLIINASTKGQSGLRQLADGTMTCLEPYSALAPANPGSVPGGAAMKPEEFHRRWMQTSLEDVLENNARSLRLAALISPQTAFFDAIYSPLETVFLRHARLTGHRTRNGKGMNIAQAAEGLFNCVFRSYLERSGLLTEATYRRIIEAMYAVW